MTTKSNDKTYKVTIHRYAKDEPITKVESYRTNMSLEEVAANVSLAYAHGFVLVVDGGVDIIPPTTIKRIEIREKVDV